MVSKLSPPPQRTYANSYLDARDLFSSCSPTKMPHPLYILISASLFSQALKLYLYLAISQHFRSKFFLNSSFQNLILNWILWFQLFPLLPSKKKTWNHLYFLSLRSFFFVHKFSVIDFNWKKTKKNIIKKLMIKCLLVFYLN